MTVSDYSEVINSTAVEAGKRAGDLAAAYELANTLGDDRAATDYLGQVKGINIVLDIIAEKLKDHSHE